MHGRHTRASAFAKLRRTNTEDPAKPWRRRVTRVSITLRKSLAKKMDGRVKPGHDELGHRRDDLEAFTRDDNLAERKIQPPFIWAHSKSSGIISYA
jgi:hypothetical protein